MLKRKTKIEELIPNLLRQISQGNGVSVNDVGKKNNVSADGVKKRLREVRDIFYKGCFDYDGSTKKWVVKSAHLGFLQKELLEPEEAVVLTAISRNNNTLGRGLVDTHDKIVSSYTKRAKSYIFKQHKAEEMTDDMDRTFALLKHAINDSKVVRLNYPSKGKDKIRDIYPYRVVYIEYYWYLICAEDNKIKSFRLSLIKSPSILEDTFKYNFEHVNLRLDLAMNAYVDYQEPFKIISVLVSKKIINHIDLASYYGAWKKLDYKTTINGEEYQRFEVTTTNPDYNDITPTIMKYMPNIIVEEPQELINKIQLNISEYKAIYNS